MQNATLEWMKSVFVKAKENDLQWKPVFPNNMPSNGVVGIYTDMFFHKEEHYQYVKFTIEFMPRHDEKGISHPDEGVRYYILHSLTMDHLEETFEIPDPSDTLYRLVRGVINHGIYTFKDDFYCKMFDDTPLSKPSDFE